MANTFPSLVREYESKILTEWTREQLSMLRRDLIDEKELRTQCATFLNLFRKGLEEGETQSIHTAPWQEVRSFLGELSMARGRQGFSPSETAAFVFSLKVPLLKQIAESLPAEKHAEASTRLTHLLDALGLHTTEVYQKGREEVIRRQQADMMELSTPVVKLWHGVLALPMIGTLDSSRTQMVMETLLQRIVETEASIAIIDITGVPTVDTLVAQHLLKTVAAARLMGAECIISGIRPQIAQTIVQLAIDLGGVTTKATIADAFAVALARTGWKVTKQESVARMNVLGARAHLDA